MTVINSRGRCCLRNRSYPSDIGCARLLLPAAEENKPWSNFLFDSSVLFFWYSTQSSNITIRRLGRIFSRYKSGSGARIVSVFFDLHRSVRQSHLHLHLLCTRRSTPTTRQPRSFTQKAFALQLSRQELPLNGQPLYHTHRHTFQHSQAHLTSVNMGRSPRKGSRSRRASPAHSGNSGSSRPARGRWTAQEVSTVHVQHLLNR